MPNENLNATLLTKILDQLNDLSEIKDLCNEIKNEQNLGKQRQDLTEKKVDAHDVFINGKNGDVGAKTKITTLENSQKSQKWFFRLVVGQAVILIFAILFFIIKTGLTPNGVTQ